MIIREFLNEGRRAEELIESDIAELERLRALAYSIQAVTGGERVRSSRRSAANFTAVIEKIELVEERLNDEIDAYVDKKEEIRRVINSLTNADERLCLKLRYLDFCSWVDIAEKMAYSERQVYRLHDRAIAHIDVSLICKAAV